MSRTSPESPPFPATLTGLERDLLGYVRRLIAVSEDSARQFEALETRSTGQIAERLNALEACVISLIECQASSMDIFGKFIAASNVSEIAPSELSEASRALAEMARSLSPPPSSQS